VVAGYWQRYCAKNETVGFFGPLAWGTVRDDGPAVAVRSRGLVASRAVHFESWCLEALVRALDVPVVVPLNRRPEVEVRVQLEALGHVGALRALERLEAARAEVASARGCDAPLAALDDFDGVFEELTGVSPAPTEEGLEGGRTPLYLDCMRDLDVDLGPALVEELARGLTVLLEASRWWCGRSFAHAPAIVAAARAEAGVGAEGPLGPLLARAVSRALGRAAATARRRGSGAATPGRRAGRGPRRDDDRARAAATFADHGPAWPLSVFHSADMQIAARDLAAIEAGNHLAVAGDFHGGNNPLMQGLFSTHFAPVLEPARRRQLRRGRLAAAPAINAATAPIKLTNPGAATALWRPTPPAARSSSPCCSTSRHERPNGNSTPCALRRSVGASRYWTAEPGVTS
jgi:hypothetical protein